MKKLLIGVLALVLVVSFSLVTAVPAGAFFWDAELRAEITSPEEGQCIVVGSTFTVEVTIYNDGTDNAEVVDVDCVLFSGLSFAAGETRHKNPPPSTGPYPYEPIEPGRSMDFSWQVVCTSPGDTMIRINPSSIGHIGEADTVNIHQAIVCPIQVTIDIKPGSDPNCINPDGHGIIPVAILTTETFDATTVDPATVELQGAAVAVKGKSDKMLAAIEDVDGDGDLDLVVKIVDNTLLAGLTEAILTGNLFDGTPIEGTDFVCIVPPE